MIDSGFYVFVMRLRETCDLEVGALGRFVFHPGWYLYTGSAKRNLRSRVERHWQLKKKVRWHIDHLSTAVASEPVGAVVIPGDAGWDECRLNRAVGELLGAVTPAARFGASDCRTGCPAHLWFRSEAVSLLEVARVHPQAALLLPGSDFHRPEIHTLSDLGRD